MRGTSSSWKSVIEQIYGFAAKGGDHIGRSWEDRREPKRGGRLSQRNDWPHAWWQWWKLSRSIFTSVEPEPRPEFGGWSSEAPPSPFSPAGAASGPRSFPFSTERSGKSLECGRVSKPVRR